MKVRHLGIGLGIFLASSSPAGERVLTRSGFVVGKNLPQSTAYLGVPFASPPMGPLRWKAPQPVRPWRGDRPAVSLAGMCAQLSALGQVVGSEDCLYLNVWVPTTRTDERLPVMVYVHGGGLMMGSTTTNDYDGASLAERGKVIVVTVQYRLAELGFLAHPALSGESAYGGSGNYGLMDQIAALKWVRDNISAFGGDSSNVTLFGESGGAASACSLLASPQTKGLFARIILESMTCPAIGKKLAEEEGMASAKAAGCEGMGAATVGCLRDKPLSALMRTPIPEMVSRKDFRRTTTTISVDGLFLPDLPLNLIRAGRGQPIPLLLGNNASEGIFFIPLYFTPTALAWQIRTFFGSAAAAELYRLYPPEQYRSWFGQAEAIFADGFFECRARRLARAKVQGGSSPVYRYLYTYGANVSGFLLPATHGSEIPFVFQHGAVVKGSPLSPVEAKLEAAFLNYWTSFARTGNPNSAGVPSWDEYSAERDNYLVLGADTAMESGRHAARCDLWDRLDPR